MFLIGCSTPTTSRLLTTDLSKIFPILSNCKINCCCLFVVVIVYCCLLLLGASVPTPSSTCWKVGWKGLTKSTICKSSFLTLPLLNPFHSSIILCRSPSLPHSQWSTLEDYNGLVCDCSALWLYQWMVSRTMQTSVICASPSEFRGQDIRSLKPASFGCSEY